ncbi:hypothetical protein PQR41_12435 [Paraburkholderia xenovorans]
MIVFTPNQERRTHDLLGISGHVDPKVQFDLAPHSIPAISFDDRVSRVYQLGMGTLTHPRWTKPCQEDQVRRGTPILIDQLAPEFELQPQTRVVGGRKACYQDEPTHSRREFRSHIGRDCRTKGVASQVKRFDTECIRNRDYLLAESLYRKRCSVVGGPTGAGIVGANHSATCRKLRSHPIPVRFGIAPCTMNED